MMAWPEPAAAGPSAPGGSLLPLPITQRPASDSQPRVWLPLAPWPCGLPLCLSAAPPATAPSERAADPRGSQRVPRAGQSRRHALNLGLG